MGKSGTAFTQADTIAYGYNDKSEVTSAVSANIATQNWGFSFDPIGNRLTSSSSETGTAVQTAYTANNLNQYSLINDGTTKTPAYDFDGNMTGDGNGWTYTWDGENRLVVAEKTGQRLEFKYDYKSRRIEKRVVDGGNETKKERFVYNRFSQIEQLNALDSNAIEKKRIWGAESKLIADINSSGTSFYAVGDDNNNISEYIDASGTIHGHYEYSPFGKATVVAGLSPDAFEFRFSSEYFDTESSLVYYNFRYYSPELGRWLSRDPAQEKGGYNPYNFCDNDPCNAIDILGLAVVKICYKDCCGKEICKETSDGQELVDLLNEIESTGGKITTANIKDHAGSETQGVGGGDSIIVSADGTISITTGEKNGVPTSADVTSTLQNITDSGTKINLNGCKTARGDDSISQRLSNALPDATVSGNLKYAITIPFTSHSIGVTVTFKGGVKQ
jgi:RHS repeat-associated protein